MRLRVLYRLGLLGVAAILLALKALYIALVGVAAGLTGLYVAALPGLASDVHLSVITVVLLATPAVTGAITVFFLLKPLLADPAPRPEPFELRPEEAPVLFAFVSRICEMIGSPSPSRIELDLQVNASARLRRGWRSLLTHDLALTIGLPLMAGLSLRQFAGVLAHEFGHFSQTAGMRLYFLIGTTRGWFSRVALDRDQWDERLTTWREGRDPRLAIMLWIASGAVWLSRLILRGLLYVANFASAWFSRQMEFDADRYEAALVGTDTFAETCQRLPLLAVAGHQVWQDLERRWRARQLTEDVPALVGSWAAAMPDETRSAIVNAALDESTGRWATHPCARARIDNVRSIAGAVIEPLAEPAEILFDDFPAICRRATLHHYRNLLGDRLAEAAFVPAGRFLFDLGAAQRREQAIARVFGALRQPWRWFRVPESLPASQGLEIRISTEDDTVEYWRLLEESLHRCAARVLLRAGAQIDPPVFHVTSGDLETVEPLARESREMLAQQMRRLREQHSSLGYLLERSSPFGAAYAALSLEQENLLELRHLSVSLALVQSNTHLLNAARCANTIHEFSVNIRELCTGILSRLGAFSSGIPSPDGFVPTLAELLLNGDTGLITKLDAGELAGCILGREDEVGKNVLGEWCAVSVQRWLRPRPDAADAATS